MNANLLSPEELKAAREWLADCSFPDVEPEDFAIAAFRLTTQQEVAA